MGFRNLKKFNLAFLAKQCLLLLHSPDSLWARVIKLRYFPNCSFFRLGKGAGPPRLGPACWRVGTLSPNMRSGKF
ncbi:hypothetical protein ACFX2J_022101 [Malus domestica]